MLAAYVYGSSWPPVVTTPHGDSASPAAFVEESQRMGDRATIAHAHDNATKYCVGGIRHRNLSAIVTDRDLGREAMVARVERGQLLPAIKYGPKEVLQFQVGACTDYFFCDFSINGNFPAVAAQPISGRFALTPDPGFYDPRSPLGIVTAASIICIVTAYR
jgi:hypothetical protein